MGAEAAAGSAPKRVLKCLCSCSLVSGTDLLLRL